MKKFLKKHILLIGVLFTLIVILLLLLEYIFFKKFSDYVIFKFFESIFISLVPVGIISLIYSYYDKIGFAKEEMEKCLYENKGYLNLDFDKKKEIIKNIEDDLYNKDENKEEYLFKTVRDEVEQLIDEWYFKSRHSDIYIKIEDNQIVKNFVVNMEIDKPSYNKNKVELKLDEITGVKSGSIDINIISFKIDGISYVLNHNDNIYDHEYNTAYNKITCFNLENKIYLKNKPIKIEFKYESKVSIEDTMYCHKIKRPCYEYNNKINYDPSKININPMGFGFMDYSKNSDRVEIINNTGSIQINFKKWVLPGDGIYVTIIPKKIKNDLNTYLNNQIPKIKSS